MTQLTYAVSVQRIDHANWWQIRRDSCLTSFSTIKLGANREILNVWNKLFNETIGKFKLNKNATLHHTQSACAHKMWNVMLLLFWFSYFLDSFYASLCTSKSDLTFFLSFSILHFSNYFVCCARKEIKFFNVS